jgi:multiple sugar transport system permease protein
VETTKPLSPSSEAKEGNRIINLLERRLPYVFPAPAVLIIGLLMLYPILYLLLISFRNYQASLVNYTFVGLRWYRELLSDDRFITALWRTIYYTAAAVAAEVSLGTLMALILNRDFRGVTVVRTLFLLPMVATPAASILIWSTMFNPSMGVLNWFLEILGLPPSVWLASPKTVIPSLLMVEVWMGSPFVMLLVLAGLRNLPVEPFECAAIDGASWWQRFVYLTMPLIRPALVTALLFRLIDTLKQFPIIWILTQGGPSRASETLYIYGYKLSFKYLEMGYGSAVLISLVFIVFFLSLFWMRMRERAWV